MRKKIWSVLLTVCLVLCMIPTAAFGDTSDESGHGIKDFGVKKVSSENEFRNEMGRFRGTGGTYDDTDIYRIQNPNYKSMHLAETFQLAETIDLSHMMVIDNGAPKFEDGENRYVYFTVDLNGKAMQRTSRIGGATVLRLAAEIEDGKKIAGAHLTVQDTSENQNGNIKGNIQVFQGAALILNSGTINGDVILGKGASFIMNGGTLQGNVITVDGASFIMNGGIHTGKTQNAADAEQFSLQSGQTYYFDLSDENIPGQVNKGDILKDEDFETVYWSFDGIPDSTMHYVPFTYTGTVDAYVLNQNAAADSAYEASAADTSSESGAGYAYPHSLFIADYMVTHYVAWNDLKSANLIHGKSYTAGNAEYILRTPSVGLDKHGAYEGYAAIPQNNEWDSILDKSDSYIKNRGNTFNYGQEQLTMTGYTAVALRGSLRIGNFITVEASYNADSQFGFRPVLEVLNADTLGKDGLKAVTLHLNGGSIGDENNIRIVVKNGEDFTAPVSDGISKPEYLASDNLTWEGSDGILYKPGDKVPADVTALTAQWDYQTYTITFDTAGGSKVSDLTVTHGEKASRPDNPARAGYTFTGWYNGDKEYDFDSPVTSALTLTAHWKADSYSGITAAEKAAKDFIRNSLTVDGNVIIGADAENYTVILEASEKYNGLSPAVKAAVDRYLKAQTGKTMQELTDEAEKIRTEISEKNISDKVKTLSVKVRSARTSKKNIRITVKCDVSEITDAGYTIKYRFYRSVKKSSGFKARIDKSTNSFINTAGKKGARYYYKASILVYDKNDRLIAQSELKQCRYTKKLWTK